jgi:DNA polymerase I-like protein with 3'-5' exonuclease and polymerase domains
MNQINPKSLKIVKGLPPPAQKGDKVALDTEWFNQTKSRLHRPHGIFAFLGATYDGKTVYYITETDQIQEFLDRLDLGVIIGHNLKYDITQLRRFAHIPQRKNIWDTMLIEQIMYSGYYDSFALKDLVRRRLDMYMPKEIRDEFTGDGEMVEDDSKIEIYPPGVSNRPIPEMTHDMLEYACVDVSATFQVYQSQRAEIDENDLRIWREIERPFLWALMAMSGIRLDTESWTALAKKNEATAEEIRKKYPINLNSPKQVKEYFSSLGYFVKSTGVEVLEQLAEECEFAKDMMVYRTFSKRSSTYGEKFITDYVEEDGRIYGDIFQMGAQTGRTSSRSPNLQNQPHEADYRSCFIAGEGNVMVIADWGSQEPRVAAFLSQDERLIEILNSDKKLYIEIARDVFGREISKQDAEYTHIKSTVLGIFYGMGAMGLAKRLGIEEISAKIMIAKILKTYPGIQNYIDRQEKAGDYVQSIRGRKIWLNKYNNGWLRDALNYPIQSSAADAMKIAAYRFVDACDEEIYQHSPLRLLVHDELVIEIEKGNGDWAKETLEKVMIEVAEEMHTGIKGSVEIFVGSNWGVKH